MLNADIRALSDDEFYKRLSIASPGSLEHGQLAGDHERRKSIATRRQRIAMIVLAAISLVVAAWRYLAPWARTVVWPWLTGR